jgi:hypothetical protein
MSILSETALGQYQSISQYLSTKWEEDSALHAQLWEMNGCLEKLATSILQIERLSIHQNELLTQAIDAFVNQNCSDAVFLGSEISSDFESLLLQSRAALDRLTNFISRQYGNYTDRFSKLRNILQKNSKKDENTDSILKIIDGAKWFEGKLIEDDLRETLRSFIAHKQSISERLEKYFQVHRLSQDQVLLYDMESKGFPFFKTAYEMGKTLSFVILNILALFTTRQIFDLTHYNPNWKNRSVVVSSFVNTSSERIRIPLVPKLTLSGFRYAEIEVDEAILTNAISFTITFSKQVKDFSKSGWTPVGKFSNGKILLVR